ncbi:site-specific integrase [Alicycliphilus denitrificans]|uniref:Integrase family protein n=1 Tax=Alicycliphilus denitrificans (strain DSM 14773 / CIP 107495 / K601) TaxID=596154 RepID=F4G7Q8_ALIDK|nr:site-specific integrase [Alicycliphilus denitrificans]AEB86655.1 integrase family protein [Alicycliphilus denitrificans K601]
MTTTPGFQALLQGFFTDRMMRQRQASPHTISSYRDSFRLLLRFAQRRIGVQPQRLTFEQIDASLVAAFLEDLQSARGISAASRNLRLTAIRSFFRYAAFELPTHAAQIQRVLAIPSKRCTRAQIGFLAREEIDALLHAPDLQTRAGRRDHALMLLAVQTGLRLSELTALRRDDTELGVGAHVRVIGKGRKERVTPLTKATAQALRALLREIDAEQDLVFCSARGTRLSADAVQHLVSKHVARAAQSCPSLACKHVTPHVLRHSAAMELLQAGVDRTVIAMWLGHESIETTQIYLDANLQIKQAALDKVQPLGTRTGRFRPDDKLLAFLQSL